MLEPQSTKAFMCLDFFSSFIVSRTFYKELAHASSRFETISLPFMLFASSRIFSSFSNSHHRLFLPSLFSPVISLQTALLVFPTPCKLSPSLHFFVPYSRSSVARSFALRPRAVLPALDFLGGTRTLWTERENVKRGETTKSCTHPRRVAPDVHHRRRAEPRD